jgi:hypothetical protein
MSETCTISEIVLLRGATLLRADTLEPIATLHDDGQWRNPEGIVTDAIGVPRTEAQAIVTSKAATEAHRKQDQAWIAEQLEQVGEIARTRRELTVDDCWQVLTMPPRKPSLMSSLMVAAQHRGLIEKTAAHRRSLRPINGGRTVRVWRSRVYQPHP